MTSGEPSDLISATSDAPSLPFPTDHADELQHRVATIELELYRLRRDRSSSARDRIDFLSGEQPTTWEDLLAENRNLKRLVAQQQKRITDLERDANVLRCRIEAPHIWPDVGVPSGQQPSALTSGEHWSGVLGSDPPMLLVLAQVEGAGSPLLCVQCDDPIRGLFTHSWHLVGAVLGCERVDQQPLADDSGIYDILREAGPAWQNQYVMSIAAIGGKHPGLKALGVGSAKKKLERAARLALAIAGHCFEHEGGACLHDPTSDGAFQYLVQLAKQARDSLGS